MKNYKLKKRLKKVINLDMKNKEISIKINYTK